MGISGAKRKLRIAKVVAKKMHRAKIYICKILERISSCQNAKKKLNTNFSKRLMDEVTLRRGIFMHAYHDDHRMSLEFRDSWKI